MAKTLLVFILLGIFIPAFAQQEKIFTYQDTLRGSNGAGRKNWDVLYYKILVEPNIEQKTIQGSNQINYLDNGVSLMQLDLQQPMQIDSIVKEGRQLKFNREQNVFWVEIRDAKSANLIKAKKDSLVVYFSGKPREAVRPPWDGGWIWRKDSKGNPFVSVACQGLGASVWMPCKDIQSDEPDNGTALTIIVPDSLMGIGNGRLTKTTSLSGNKKAYEWVVKSPINSYNIVPYIGKYTHIQDTYAGENGNLSLDYWVLNYNREKAIQHFEDAPKMLKAFEYWLGPYPFYSGGYKLVEAPHLGMEHQSNIAYGNKYLKGYMGSDRSSTGWGLKWDFIIVHESGHEWFGNNITAKDIADMWVHESFTTYSETLFTEYYWGKEAGNDYIIGQRKNISNNKPIIGLYGVNEEGSSDMYDKGANMIHTIRQVMNNDEKFRNMLREMNSKFRHQTVTGKQIEQFISTYSGIDFSSVFQQYLYTTQIPVLEYKICGKKLCYRYSNVVDGFKLSLKVSGLKSAWVTPTTTWKSARIKHGEDFRVDRNFYIQTQK